MIFLDFIPYIKNALILLVAASVLLSGCAARPSPEELKPKQEIAAPRPVISFFYTAGRGPGSSYNSLLANKSLIDEISPLWYHLKPDGSLVENVDPEALKAARENGLKVVPLVALQRGGSGVLKDPAALDRAAAEIVRAVSENGYDGINIDIEIIRKQGLDYRAEMDGLTLLVSGVQRKLKPAGKRLDLSVAPPRRPPSHLAPIYDCGKLSGLADRTVIMTYDYSHSGSLPGPVAPLPWVEENITAALAEGFKPENISLGIAAYGYDWPLDSAGGEARPAWDILSQASAQNISLSWNDTAEVPYIIYSGSRDGKRIAWFENRASTEKKLELAKKYRLAGISVWRLGYEDPGLWGSVAALRAARIQNTGDRIISLHLKLPVVLQVLFETTEMSMPRCGTIRSMKKDIYGNHI